MYDDTEITSPHGGTPRGNNNHDQSTPDKNNYITRLPTFSGNSTEFDWCESKMYTHIIGFDDNLWDILEDGINFKVDGLSIVTNRKNLRHAQKKVYRKHYKVRGILVEFLPHSEYIKIIDKSTAKSIFESLCATYEGNQQVKEVKANVLV